MPIAHVVFSSPVTHHHLHLTSPTLNDLEAMSDQNLQGTQLVVIGDEDTDRVGRRAGLAPARMGLAAFLLVVEALYQSADAFPPLKSAVGAITAIVTLCEVCARNIFSFLHIDCLTIEGSRKPERCDAARSSSISGILYS